MTDMAEGMGEGKPQGCHWLLQMQTPTTTTTTAK